jgi:hypothetical protein
MKIFRIEWYADAYPAIGKYCQEYFRNPVTAANRLVDLQAMGYDPTIETVLVCVD